MSTLIFIYRYHKGELMNTKEAEGVAYLSEALHCPCKALLRLFLAVVHPGATSPFLRLSGRFSEALILPVEFLYNCG